MKLGYIAKLNVNSEATHSTALQRFGLSVLAICFILSVSSLYADEEATSEPSTKTSSEVTTLAQSGSSGSSTNKKQRIIYKKKTYFDFEDTLIRGRARRPAGSQIFSRKHPSFITSIELKRSFMPELRQTQSGGATE